MRAIFQTFYSLDEAAFTKLTSELGYAAVACYRLRDKALTYVIGSSTQSENIWPAFFRLDQLNYTTEGVEDVPLGWLKDVFKRKQKKNWPKGIFAYFPEQELRIAKFLFLVIPKMRRKIIVGELDGGLEAVAARISQYSADAEMRHFINEAVMQEHTRKLSLLSQTLIDHELRTPLSNIQGYAFLQLEESSIDTIKQHSQTIAAQTNVALSAIEKLDVTIRSNSSMNDHERQSQAISLATMMQEIVADVIAKDKAERGEVEPARIYVVCSEEMSSRQICGVEDLLRRAFSEVIHNAVLYSQYGDVRISIYQNEQMAIIDIEDHGDGVPHGIEDLIFLQFFRGHNNQKIRRGHRGLGLGLYLARYVAEQHMGQLLCVRRIAKGALFRFILPLAEVERLQQPKRVG